MKLPREADEVNSHEAEEVRGRGQLVVGRRESDRVRAFGAISAASTQYVLRTAILTGLRVMERDLSTAQREAYPYANESENA